MIVVFLGPPGAGKGTQASRLSAKYALPKVSTGDMLRGAVAADSPLGRRVASIMDSGELVDDDTMAEVVRARLGKPDVASGAVLDGYPRTLAQAQTLASILEEQDRQVELVLFLHVPEEDAVERLSRRRACPECGANYHLSFNPPAEEGECDRCGAKLVHREDDREEVVRERLQVYRERTEPLVDAYRAQDLLVQVEGTGSIDDVWDRVDSAMARAARS